MKDDRANVSKLRLHDTSHTDRNPKGHPTKLANAPAAYIRHRFRKMSATHLGTVLFTRWFHMSRSAKFSISVKRLTRKEWVSIQLVECIRSRIGISEFNESVSVVGSETILYMPHMRLRGGFTRSSFPFFHSMVRTYNQALLRRPFV